MPRVAGKTYAYTAGGKKKARAAKKKAARTSVAGRLTRPTKGKRDPRAVALARRKAKARKKR